MSGVHVAIACEAWVPEADCGLIDSKIVELAHKKGELDEEIGGWLLAAQRAGVHKKLGFASLEEYAQRRLGFDGRTLKERLRVATALEALPRLRALLRSGARSFSGIREIVRVANPEKEEAWIERTEGLSVREIERLVAGHRYGDSPSDARDPLLERRRMVFDLAPDVFALVLDAVEHVRDEIGAGASNEQVLRAMAENVLGPRRGDPEHPPYQVAVTVCALCDRTWRHAGGEDIEVPDSVGACALCDGEVVGATEIEGGRGRPAANGLDRLDPDAENPSPAAAPPAHVGSPALPSSALEAFMRAASDVFKGPRKSLTPLRRRFVLARDRYRCIVPGCGNHRFLDIHHLEGRGGADCHDPDKLVTLCDTHHRLHHEGYLAIEGTLSQGLRFTHGGGTAYGAPLRPADAGPKTSVQSSDHPVARSAVLEDPRAS